MKTCTNLGVALQCLDAIRIKPKYFYIRLICAHAPTEDKDDSTKDAFYDKLEVLYSRCPRSGIKMLVGDFNAKVGREGIFGPTVGKHSLHEKKSDNGFGILRCRTNNVFL